MYLIRSVLSLALTLIPLYTISSSTGNLSMKRRDIAEQIVKGGVQHNTNKYIQLMQRNNV